MIQMRIKDVFVVVCDFSNTFHQSFANFFAAGVVLLAKQLCDHQSEPFVRMNETPSKPSEYACLLHVCEFSC
jgi:hypothetical protein